MNEARARRELVRYSRQMHAAGYVANHDGNLSVRGAAGRFICTPTAFSKLDVAAEDLLVVDAAGARVTGSHKPFGELNLHLSVYAARADAMAVVHAHPVSATAFGAAGQGIPHPFLPEAVVSLGAEVPTVPLAEPGKAAAAALGPVLLRCDVVLLAGNGVLAWGPSLEVAYLRLELVEHLARIALAAAPLGGVRKLPDDLVRSLVAKRAAAGLAAPAEVTGQPKPPPVDAPAEAAKRALAGVPSADPALVARLAREIAEKLTRR